MNYWLERLHVEINIADIMKLTNEESIQKFVRSFLNNPHDFEISMTKDNEQMSMIHESTGDILAARDEFLGALHAYSCAIGVSALPFSVRVGNCLAKRATVLQEMKLHEDALNDIRCAFNTPIHETTKVQLRCAEREIIDILAKERISDLFATMSAQEEEPVLLEGENEEIPGASKAMAFLYNEEFGRHFVATMPIKAGDVLIVEKPSYALSMNKCCNRTNVCTYCLKYCLVPIPCKHCLKEVFCSEQCLEEATKKYHKLECKKLDYVEFDDCITAAIRMLLIFAKEEVVRKDAIKFMNKLDKQEGQEDPRTTGFTDNKFIGNNIQAILSLNHKPTSTVDPASRVLSAFVAHTAAKLRQKCDFLQNNSEVLGVAKLLYRLAFIYQENSMKIKHKNIPVGFGLYPTFSFVNHSCVPNAIITTCRNYRKVLRACKDIKPGEQIFRSYLQESLIMDSTERKDHLQKSFEFSCSCEACKANYIFKNEAKEKLLLPKALQRRLRKSPIDIEAMWTLLRIMQRDIKQPCVEVEIMNEALSDAYSGIQSHNLGPLYAHLGIL